MRTARVIPTTSFAIQMMDSGHKEGFRDMVISRVVAKYLNSLERHNRGLQPPFRTRDEREAAWSEAGGRPDKWDWFRCQCNLDGTCTGGRQAGREGERGNCAKPHWLLDFGEGAT